MATSPSFSLGWGSSEFSVWIGRKGNVAVSFSGKVTDGGVTDGGVLALGAVGMLAGESTGGLVEVGRNAASSLVEGSDGVVGERFRSLGVKDPEGTEGGSSDGGGELGRGEL